MSGARSSAQAFLAPYLAPSPHVADGGEKAGKDPRKIPVALLADLGHPQSPIKAIRAHCVTCSGGSVAEARKCTATACELWPMRMGVNPFHKRARTVEGGA